MDYVAGYTVVIDSQINDYYNEFAPELGKTVMEHIETVYDWYAGATCSWGGKKSDAHCVMGPYLVTKDEVGNPYDLLVYTRQSGFLRDRSHTAGTSIGIERTIHFYSSFATLYPGDVIHMGTVGADGLPVTQDMDFGPDDFIESEIEKIGVVRARVLDANHDNWLSEKEKALPSLIPAVRDFIKAGTDHIASITEWNKDKINNVWTCYGNYKNASEPEGPKNIPGIRFLNGPNTSIGITGQTVTLPSRVRDLNIGVELGFVIDKMASKVKKERAGEYILGFAPVISISDTSFADALIEPATPQERGICEVYGRWGDNYNILGGLTKTDWNDIADSAMILDAGISGRIETNINEYTVRAERVLEFISSHITIFPGDVVLMGRTSKRLLIKAVSFEKINITCFIEGLEKAETMVVRKQHGGSS
jgi:2-keto-4-pentenoate hydratase/2-oxohepta-3-ene-1,7-dioic acid hydratase in catechol pathway